MATNNSEAHEPSSNLKTLIESFLMYFRGSAKDTNNLHVKPDIYILTEPGTCGFIKYTSDNGSGKPELKIKFPPEYYIILKKFSLTEKKTEFLAMLERLKSTLKTEENNRYTMNPFSEENKVDRSTQTITERHQTLRNFFLNIEVQKLDLPKGSFINEGREETQQGKLTPELESICAERVNLNGESAPLLSLTYQDNNKNYDSIPCLLLSYNGTFYSPEAFRFLRAQKNIDKSKLLNILLISRNGKLVHIEKLEDVSAETAEIITNEFQTLDVNWVKQACNLKDNIKSINVKINESTPSGSPLVSKKLVETEQKASNDKCTIDREESVPIRRTRVATNCVKRKQSKQSMWTIYLQSHDDRLRDLVHEYFSDDLVCMALNEFFGRDIHPLTKFPYERPHVPWPSMHPLLPYKLRYLDDNETNEGGGGRTTT